MSSNVANFIKRQWCNSLCGPPRTGYVETFRVGGVVCRALISKHGEVISNLDCWKVEEKHPSYESTEEVVRVKDEIHTPYLR